MYLMLLFNKPKSSERGARPGLTRAPHWGYGWPDIYVYIYIYIYIYIYTYIYIYIEREREREREREIDRERDI